MNNAPLENPFASTHSLDENPFDHPDDQAAAPAQDASVAAREAELNRRAQELDARQRDLERQQQNMRPRKNNWPFFFPLIYHEISDEIPTDSQPLMYHLYYLWLILGATLIVNMIACIFILLAGSSDGGRDLGSSIGYIFVIGILSFLLWYRPIYNAYMKVQALYYYFFFFFCGWHLVFSIYMILGIPGTGSAGFIQMIQMYVNGHIAAGVFGTIATLGWTVQGLGNAFYYQQIWKHHNAQGHTLDNAKTELATHWAKRQLFGSKQSSSTTN
ncbi:scamp-domain-containing protein [Fomitiporia mediterranea MF3/22]|uniref:scamp-domain-containing protein n=1 Tax=Fomitiporia mediterranea (strain MF3/22) TaxID=694068 RepID=UPI0004407D78|nr:scamp-domain-containing protein [Fomitiporia mediterranea MF3/22]EJD02344.1 scamp-domain-containing protein [Fomitiporia mediterranea MF3/22]